MSLAVVGEWQQALQVGSGRLNRRASGLGTAAVAGALAGGVVTLVGVIIMRWHWQAPGTAGQTGRRRQVVAGGVTDRRLWLRRVNVVSLVAAAALAKAVAQRRPPVIGSIQLVAHVRRIVKRLVTVRRRPHVQTRMSSCRSSRRNGNISVHEQVRRTNGEPPRS